MIDVFQFIMSCRQPMRVRKNGSFINICERIFICCQIATDYRKKCKHGTVKWSVKIHFYLFMSQNRVLLLRTRPHAILTRFRKEPFYFVVTVDAADPVKTGTLRVKKLILLTPILCTSAVQRISFQCSFKCINLNFHRSETHNQKLN